jgi:hypothetical protein
LNRRLGLCLGVANATAYLVVLALPLFSFSYWTVQLASGDRDPKWMRLINSLGRDMESTGFTKVAAATDAKPQTFYNMADLAGALYCNPLTEARLLLYPGFLTLTERQEFQDIANDNEFTSMWQRHDPIMSFWDYPKTQAILKNSDLLALIWNTAAPNLSDLGTFLESGQSPKFASEGILGRWSFDVNAALISVRRAKPNIAFSEMQKVKAWMTGTFAKTSLVAMTDNHIILKNVPPLGQTAASGVGLQTIQGEWTNLNGKYALALTSGANSQTLSATVEGERMTIKWSLTMDMVFERQD